MFNQNLQGSNWIFGNRLLLNFNSKTPVLDTSSVSLQTYFPASISESNGHLLFYSGIGNVYNGNHMLVSNNSEIPYNPSIQRGLIVKMPLNNSYYYFYTKYETPPKVNSGSLYFAIYNPSLKNGTGDLVRNSHTQVPGRYHIKTLLCADHSNGIDKWILLADSSNVLNAFQLTSSGLNKTPIVSTDFTQLHRSSNPLEFECFKNSPSSEVLGVSMDTEGELGLFNFDRFTGKGSSLPFFSSFKPIQGYYFGGFSSNSKVFYVSTKDYILQYDISSKNQGAILSSEYIVSNKPSSTPLHYDFQLGIDGALYNIVNAGYLNKIQCPNLLKSRCNYLDSAISLYGKNAGVAFPTLNQTLYVNTHKLQAQSLGDSVVCPGDSVTLTAYGAATSEFYWSPAAGLSCTNCQSPKVSPSSTTTYTVRGIARSCAKDVNHSAQITIYVSPPKGQASINGDTVLCPGKTAVLSGPAGFNTYAWSNGVVGRTQTVQAGGSYQLQVSNKCYTDTLSYTLKTEPVLAYRFPNDTVVCASDLPIELSGWSNFPFSINYSNQPKYEVTRPGEYIYEVRSACSSLDYFVKVDTAKIESRVLDTTVPDSIVAGAKQRFEFSGYAVGSNKEVSAFEAEDSVQITQLEDDKNGWIEIYQLRNNGVCSDTLFIKRIEIIKPQAPDTLPQKSDCKVELAPNPGSLEFSLSTNQNIEQLAVFDARSKKLIELESLEKGVYTFSAAKWSAGTYYISAQCADGSLKKLRWIKVK